MKKSLIAALLALMVLGACGKEEVTEPEPAAEREREEKPAAADPEPAEPTEAPAPEDVTLRGSIVTHDFSTEERVEPDDDEESEAFPIAYSVFQTVELDDASRAAYPELAEALDEYNRSKEESAVNFLWGTMYDIESDPDFSNFMYYSFLEEDNLDLMRADDKIVSFCIDTYGSYNGAHPVTWYNAVNINTQTGLRVPLSDVVSDVKGLPQLILDNLETVVDDYEFTDEDNEEMLAKIESYVADGALVWTVSDTAMDVYFDAYALQYYAFGPIFATLKYSDYPDLLVDEFKPDASTGEPLEDRFKEETAQEEKFSNDELKELEEQYSDGSVERYIYSPDWSVPYVSEDASEGLTDVPYEIKEQKKEEVMFAEDWANANGVVIPGMYKDTDGRFSVDGYTFEPHNDADNGVLYLTYYEDTTLTAPQTYHFETFLYTPNPGNEYTTAYIRFAKVVDDTLYLNIAHRTYSADQPDTAYMLAVDLESGFLKWKSENLVANSDNFVVYDDTVICGYGFTDEDDYIYILSKYTGAVLKKIKVKTSPDYFYLDGDTLYVICYDTAYTYSLK